MKLYALISGENTVSGILQLADDTDIGFLTDRYAQVVDITNSAPLAQLGWTFDGQNVVGTSVSKKITKLAMRQRFTVSEMMGIMTASSTIPIVRYLMDNLAIATYVDLARPDTQAGLGILVAYNLVTQERVNAILSTPVSIIEAYTG